jgi:hypothetical protein
MIRNERISAPAPAGVAIVATLVIGLALAGCGLFDMPKDEPPNNVRVELNGATDTRAKMVFSQDFLLGDDLPIFLAADTVEGTLPMSQNFDLNRTEFWLYIHRDSPEADNMSIRVWAGDFLFVDDPVLPDTQQTVRIRYSYSSFR